MKQNFLEAISKHTKTCYITTWIMVESTTSAGLQVIMNCGGTSDILGSRAAIQRGVNRQEKKSTARTLMKLNKGNCKVLCLGWNNPCSTASMGSEGQTARKELCRKGRVEPGGYLKVECESAVCPCGQES